MISPVLDFIFGFTGTAYDGLSYADFWKRYISYRIIVIAQADFEQHGHGCKSWVGSVFNNVKLFLMACTGKVLH